MYIFFKTHIFFKSWAFLFLKTGVMTFNNIYVEHSYYKLRAITKYCQKKWLDKNRGWWYQIRWEFLSSRFCAVHYVIIKICFKFLLQWTLYNRHDRYWQTAYPKFLIVQNCIKKDLEIYIYIFYLVKLSWFLGQFSRSALVIVDSLNVKYCSVLTQYYKIDLKIAITFLS